MSTLEHKISNVFVARNSNIKRKHKWSKMALYLDVDILDTIKNLLSIQYIKNASKFLTYNTVEDSKTWTCEVSGKNLQKYKGKRIEGIKYIKYKVINKNMVNCKPNEV